MDIDFTAMVIVPTVVIGLPWLILHYVTQWKRAKGMTAEDENMLDEMHETARRLDARLESIERIMTVDHPGWKERATGITDRSGRELPRH
ncbi:envelope stress response membrane protein PspB [Polymorphobacter arshaanensis]|uniref:Envelope stress response membrane protein PspB n=1 Tax=Glacieibacterium arshaanense TaxID=2511025 RepID=A0A4Y9EK24_9SPHN|nr:envelope stress response membrane protein PspB [Polymorphobacter arshaanensis]TFU01132.1 envelope stress response membrane protein PspB [Polymorphobacter arshaanensis]